ncbi:MAG: hypothetical protein ACJ75G_08955 [Gaiellaceae bacterium]
MALTHLLLFFHLLGAVSFFAGAAVTLGGYGGRTARHACHLAERLAGRGDEPSAELRALVAAREPLAASYVSGLLLLAILALMVWQPD